ncbi:HlyD family secretion protein [Bradyrhizobium mercantei]|uniref:HlyD family secretion protein n=1 Tax=Bradyrhizobium mercantei TaxID=1904807 RepID=UPI000976B139|nr:HlyD family secretion protein [Bradyrhizobium mercantei]
MNKHHDLVEFHESPAFDESDARDVLRELKENGLGDQDPDAKGSKRKGKSRKRRLLLAIGAVLLLGIGIYYGTWYWTTGRFEETTDDAYVKADSTIIAPKVSGYLRKVAVSDNQPVRAGQTLAQIDDRDYRVALKQATANVEAARATVANIEANIEQQTAIVAQARASVVVDQANLIFAQQENDRYVTLANSGSGSVQNAQNAVSKLGIAKATLERDGAAVIAAEKQAGSLKAQLAKVQADLVHAQGLEEQAQLNLSYTTIVAPVDGVVGNRALRVGQYVQAGTPLMSVVPLMDVYVVANFKETQLTYVRPGQPVRIAIDTYPGHDVIGAVDSISPASGQDFALLPPDNATGNFTKIVQRIPVKITVSPDLPPAGRLLSGMSVVPTIDTRAERLR